MSTSVEEAVLELESLQGVFHLLLQEEGSLNLFTRVLNRLVGIMVMTLRDTMSTEQLDSLAELSLGDTT